MTTHRTVSPHLTFQSTSKYKHYKYFPSRRVFICQRPIIKDTSYLECIGFKIQVCQSVFKRGLLGLALAWLGAGLVMLDSLARFRLPRPNLAQIGFQTHTLRLAWISSGQSDFVSTSFFCCNLFPAQHGGQVFSWHDSTINKVSTNMKQLCGQNIRCPTEATHESSSMSNQPACQPARLGSGFASGSPHLTRARPSPVWGGLVSASLGFLR
jgi:hypothetical protein